MKAKWNKQTAKRWDELVLLECTQKATPEQVAELNKLQTLRRRALCSPTIEELLQRRDNARVMRRLMSEIKKFIAAHSIYYVDQSKLTYSSHNQPR